MKKLKLSAVYTALIASGLAVSSAESFATTCNLPATIENNNVILSQCTKTTDEGEGITLNSGTLFIKNSKLNVSGGRTWGSESSVLNSSKSIITIENSTLSNEAGSTNNYVIRDDNSTITVSNSTLTLNTTEYSDGGSLVDLTNSTITISNSTLVNNKEELDILRLNNKSSATLNNITVTIPSDSTLLSFYNTNNKATLNNVTANVSNLIGSWWDANGGIEYGGIDLTINNSSLYSELISAASEYDEDETIMAETINLIANNSTLSGSVVMPNNTLSTSNYTITLNNSTWNTSPFIYMDDDKNEEVIYENKMNNLTLNNGTVNLEKVDDFQTLTVGNLSGTGNFTLNTDLANQQSDKIVVTGSDSGSFGLNINDSGNEPNVSNGKVTLVEAATGTAKFALLGNDYVDAGAYRYRLNQEGNNWVLSNKAGESSKTTQPEKPVEQPKPVVPVEQPKPTTPSTSEQTTEAKPTLPVVPVMPPEQPKNPSNTEQTTEVSPTQPTVPVTPTEQPKPTTPEAVFPPMVEKALSEKSNALVSLRQAQLALVESNLEGLHQRLGELKNGEKGNVWVRNVNSRNKFDSTRTASDSHSSGFEQDIHSVQLGADAALTDNIRLGGFVGNARSDVDFDGEYSSGKVKTQSLGIYGTYLANNGFYWDNVAKYEYVKSESASTGKRKYNAYTLSTEIGRIHQLGQGWTATPQIQAAWTRLSSQSDEERLSALTARAGVRVAKAIEFDGWKLQPYAEVNGITTQTNQNAVRVNQYLFDVAESKGRIQTALGINAAVGNHRLGLEGSVTNGKYLDQPYKVQAVYRYSW
ncbi:pertactin precursor [Actinobacillus minor 202]|uniref:Pertactin n=1 Tax=Actinobacillus minor 202 TaxID=591023 RepID=A0ABM9YU77_9PAST|nr:autotransporter outer membrane beta-barrel domain-containing protein [Actinobacillus minor]EEV24832.1 pertactin precursor [Actinobacillus minor 202]